MSRLIFSMKNEYVLVYEDFFFFFFWGGGGVVRGIESAPSPLSLYLTRPPGGGGYSDIFTHTYAWAIFGVQNSEFQYFWGFSEK